MSKTKYNAVWVPGSFFEKGHWKLTPKSEGDGMGVLILLGLLIVVICFAILILPFIICLIGFSLIRSKRYYASIFSFLALLYLYFDYKKEWVTAYIIFGTNEENYSNGLIGFEYAPYFFLFNSIAIGIAFYFVVSSYYVNSNSSNKELNFIENDKNIISIIIGFVFGLLTFLYIKNSGFDLKSNFNNNTINSVIDSSSVTPSSNNYEEKHYDTTSNYKNNSASIDDKSINNQNFVENEPITSKKDYSDDTIYNEDQIDVKPNFPGGIDEFYKYVGRTFQVPDEEGLNGKVFVNFIIEKDGSLTEIKVIRDIGYGTGNEAIRILKTCPKWYPGEQSGKKVRVIYSLPINIQSQE